jgi:S1/P1 Nuclease
MRAFLPFLRLLAVLALIPVLAAPAWAWNFPAHWIAAAIAYQRLTPAVRARVDEVLRHHPDYEKMNFPDAPTDPESRARAAFIHAASWPDEIRNDERFYDDTHADATPTPVLPGFPGMQRHTNWHYINMPFSQDDTRLTPTPTPNVVTELRRLLDGLSPTADPAAAAYDLPWLIHLVADAHNPIHAGSRVSKEFPMGDGNGSLVFVPGKTLHGYWDDAASPKEVNYADILKYAKAYMAQQPPPVSSTLNPKVWLDDSFKLAKSDVYTFGPESGTKEKPISLPSGYAQNAQKVAKQRLIQSAYLLGSALNLRLR